MENINYSEQEEPEVSEMVVHHGDGLGITKSMIEEEKNLHKKNQQEMEKLRKKNEDENYKQEMKEKRYKCLLTLLEKSQFYTNILHEKLETSLKANEENKKKKQFSDMDSGELKELMSKAACTRRGTRLWKKNNVESTKNETTSKTSNEGEIDVNLKTTKLTSMGIEVPIEQPSLLEGACLRDYQLKGFDWIRLLYQGGMNGILADEMGLGKTLMCIAFLCYLYENGITGPFLIVGPLSTLPNWMLEFQRFAPQVPVLLYHGNKPERESLRSKMLKTHSLLDKMVYPVVLTSYEVPIFDCTYLSRPKWKVMVIDEGHRLKNHNGVLYRVLSNFQSGSRLLMTGTPLQNNLPELWSLLHFLLPELFNKLEAFQEWFQIDEMEKADSTHELIRQEKKDHVLKLLHNILSPFLLRRCKADVNLNLPPKKEVVVYCPLTPMQHKLYQSIIDKTIEKLILDREQNSLELEDDGENRMTRLRYKKFKSGKSHMSNKGTSVDSEDSNGFDSLVEGPSFLPQSDKSQWADDMAGVIKGAVKMTIPYMMLRKVVNHLFLLQQPVLDRDVAFDDRVITSSGKAQIMDQLLARLKAGNHKVLIFSTFVMILDLLEEVLDLRGYEYRRLDGLTSLENRKQAIYEFNTNPSIFAFLCSTRAGGLGINLVAADTVILYDSDWNPQVDLQAQDRCHRIGQTRPVMVYRLVCDGTIDERMVLRAESKRKLEKMVLRKGNFTHDREKTKSNKQLCLEELKELLESKQHEYEVHPNGSLLTDDQWALLLDRSNMK